MFGEALLGRGLDLEDVFRSAEDARRFVDSMPRGDVWVTLLTVAHRNPQTRWTSNDIFDFDALSAATAYCDIVVTERHAHHVLHRAGLPERLNTLVLATPDELVDALGERGR
jgi:hypothetical protein